MKKLSPKPARTDLTDRECAKLLGSCIGGLTLMADKQAVRDAVRWWAETDAAWDSMLSNDQANEATLRAFGLFSIKNQ